MSKKIRMMSKKRLVMTLGLACALFLGLIFRTGYLQLIKGEWLSSKAQDQQTREIPIDAKRGAIYDTNMKKLAESVTKYTVWCKPVEVKDKDEASKKVAEIIDKDVDEVAKLVGKKNTALVRVQRWIDDETAEKIREAKIPGIWVAEDNQRYYPYGRLASYVLGHTSKADATGLAGVELKYDKILKGTAGRLITATDASGREIAQGTEKYYEAVQGNGIVLTIDETIQHYAESAVQKAYEINNAKRVSLLAMDPKTGNILAMASVPNYDPNDPNNPIYEYYKDVLDEYKDDEKIKGLYQMWRNPLVSDTYEPGSTFKLVTTSAALEENVVKEGETFNCTGGVVVGGRRLKCWRHYRPHGSQTLAQGVQNSCNPVFIELGKRLGVKKLYDYIEGYGLMAKTGIDLPGEGKGLFYNEKNVGPVELSTISFGQSISVTPVQLLTGISAIANDGKLMQPRTVRAYTDNKGNITKEVEPKVVRQVISEETSNQMMEIAESVVRDGGGNKAYIPGMRIGGKTGTAQKVINGVYAQGKYICSFVGIAPVDDPQIVMIAIVDEPGYLPAYGGTTAGPIIKEVMGKSLNYLGVEPKYTKEELEKEKKEAKIDVPEVRNLSVEDATKLLEESGLKAALDVDTELPEGEKVVDMFPKPGSTKMKEGDRVMLYFDQSIQKEEN